MPRTSEDLANWQGYATLAEVAFIKECAKNLVNDPAVAVNLGAGAGTSTLAMLEANSSIIVYSVDRLTTEREVTTNEHLRLEEIDTQLKNRVIKIWGDSQVIGQSWPPHYPIDLLYVDADHTAPGLRRDLYWLDYLRPGGLVLLHDYGSPKWPDVKQVVDGAMGGGMFRGNYYRKFRRVDTLIAFIRVHP